VLTDFIYLKGRYHLGDLSTDGSVVLIEVELEKIGCESVNWIELAQDRLYL
jgi:hypothetical protein